MFNPLFGLYEQRDPFIIQKVLRKKYKGCGLQTGIMKNVRGDSMERKHQGWLVWSVVLWVLVLPLSGFCETSSPMAITNDHKCHTCGMRVAEFENWHTQIVYGDGTNDAFCAVKCLMAFYFEPSKYVKENKYDNIKALYAKDYYSQKWHDMKTMVFVLGSDVMGPMGKDLVPFSNLEHAKAFMEDHNGSQILTFEEITLDLIRDLRKKKSKGL